jgi:hypothetical protein
MDVSMACPKDMRTTRPHTLWVGVCTCPEGTEPAIPRRQLSSLLPTGHLLHKRIKLSRVLIRTDPPSKPLDQVVTAPLADFVLCQGLVVLLTEPADRPTLIRDFANLMIRSDES